MAPLVSSVDLKYTPGEAQKPRAGGGLAPLGTGLTRRRSAAPFDSRWIDPLSERGQGRRPPTRIGGAYDVHPYMLINYNGQYADVRHAGARARPPRCRAYYSNKTQPYPAGRLPRSSSPEVGVHLQTSRLLIDYNARPQNQGRTTRGCLSLLGNYLENIKGTVFRPDPVRRIRAADARDGARRGAAD